MTIRVAALHTAPARRAPMVAVDHVDAEAGRGLVGDRYHGTRHRHVSVQSRDDLAAAAEALGAPVPEELTRRTVTLDHGEVPTEPGARLVIGDVVLEVVRKAAPCRVMDESVGPGAARALHGRGGAIFRVLASGSITVGDDVRTGAEPGSAAGADGGGDAVVVRVREQEPSRGLAAPARPDHQVVDA